MAKFSLLLAGICLALSSDVRGQTPETYTIKIKQPEQGESHLFKNTIESKSAQSFTDSKGQLIQEFKLHKSLSTAYKAIIVKKQAGQTGPTAMKREYEKAIMTVDGDVSHLTYEGKTLVFDKKGDGYQF